MNMSGKSPVYLGALGLLLLIGGNANADIVTIDFEEMTDNAFYGKNNTDGFANCAGFYNCYSEGGLVFGTPDDVNAPFSHVHRAYDPIELTTGLEYHGDSAGVYVRSADLSAFNLESLVARDIAGTVGTTFNIIGFSEAYNPTIVGESGPFAGQVAADVITQNGIKTFDSSFENIKAFWVFYDGHSATPSDGTNWDIVLDDIQISPVPLPAAAWFMGTAVLGLFGFTARSRRG
jgi:hypothetical protein